MAKKDLVEELAKKYGPKISKAFVDAMNRIKDAAVKKDIIARFQKGDIEGIINGLGLDNEAFYREFNRAIEDAFTAAGDATVKEILPKRVAQQIEDDIGHLLKIQFNVRDVRAEEYLDRHSSDRIKKISEDAKIAVRQNLTRAMAAGDNPTSVADNLVGRVNRATGAREGGIIGLASNHEQWLASYEARLRSADPAEWRKALGMGLRDARYDKSVLKAIANKQPLSEDRIKKMVARYRARALKYRSDMIGRTESLGALDKGRWEAWEQAIDAGQVDEAYVEKTWHTAGDELVRHSHESIDGKTLPFRQPFHTSAGNDLLYPHDPAAPEEEVIQCRCWMSIRMNYTRQAMANTKPPSDDSKLKTARSKLPDPRVKLDSGDILPDDKKAAENYIASSYNVNSYLRGGGEVVKGGTVLSDIPAIDRLTHGSRLSGDMTLYRGVDQSSAIPLSTLKPGDVFFDRGFTSTTKSSDVAFKFAGGGSRYNQGWVMEFEVKSGQRALDMMGLFPEKLALAKEREVLLPRDYPWEVSSVDAETRKVRLRSKV